MSERVAEIVMKIKDVASAPLASIDNALWNIGKTATTSGVMTSQAIDKVNKDLDAQAKRIAAVTQEFDKQHARTMLSASSISSTMSSIAGGLGSAVSMGFSAITKVATIAWDALTWVYDEVVKLAEYGFVSLAGALAFCTHEWIKQEDANAKLQAVYKATGGVVGYTVKELEAYATTLQSVSTIGDDTWEEAMSSLMTFGNIQRTVFKDAIRLSGDLAAVMGGDLSGASLQLGRALSDPVQGMTALRRAGIIFSADQQEQIKLLVEENNLYQAQGIILAAMEQKVGGAAAAMRTTLGGSLKALWNSIGDAAETVGASFAPIFQDAAESVRKWVEDSTPQIEQFAQKAAEYVRFAGTVIGDFIGDGSDWTTKWQVVWTTFTDLMTAAIKTAADLAVTGGSLIVSGLMKGFETKVALGSAFQIIDDKQKRGDYRSQSEYEAARRSAADYIIGKQVQDSMPVILSSVDRSKGYFSSALSGTTKFANTMMPNFAGNIADQWSETQRRIADIGNQQVNAQNRITDGLREQTGLLTQHEQIRKRIADMTASEAQKYLAMTDMERAQTRWMLQNSNMEIGGMTHEMQQAIAGSSFLSNAFSREIQQFVAKDIGFPSTRASGGGLKVTIDFTDRAHKSLQVVEGAQGNARQGQLVRASS